MAARKNPLADRAYELYKGGMKLVDIADQIGVPRQQSVHGKIDINGIMAEAKRFKKRVKRNATFQRRKLEMRQL